MYIEHIESPAALKKLSPDQLRVVADEIRQGIVHAGERRRVREDHACEEPYRRR
jgi:deoxyxylulose-5-phosphate synthase